MTSCPHNSQGSLMVARNLISMDFLHIITQFMLYTVHAIHTLFNDKKVKFKGMEFYFFGSFRRDTVPSVSLDIHEQDMREGDDLNAHNLLQQHLYRGRKHVWTTNKQHINNNTIQKKKKRKLAFGAPCLLITVPVRQKIW